MLNRKAREELDRSYGVSQSELSKKDKLQIHAALVEKNQRERAVSTRATPEEVAATARLVSAVERAETAEAPVALARVLASCLANEMESDATALEGVFLALADALRKAHSPALMILVSGGQLDMFKNFWCGLAGELEETRKHLVVWAADAAAASKLATLFPEVNVVLLELAPPNSTSLSAQRAGGGAEFRSPEYARYAVVKALMPLAAFALGHAAVTQDVDVVWKQDVFLYLRRAAERWNVSLALTPDAPIASGKVGKRDSPAVNGGFLFVAEPVAFRKARRKSASSKVLHGYAQKCHEILEARRNQHLLARTLATAGLSIVREADFLRAARPDERERVLLLEPSQFANGYPLLTLHASLSDVTFYHANFATTWAQKCSKLAATRSLFVSPNAADARCRCESRVPCHAPRAPFFNSNPTADDRAYADFVKSITSSTRAPCPDITNTTAPPGKAPPANGARTSTPPPLTDSRH